MDTEEVSDNPKPGDIIDLNTLNIGYWRNRACMKIDKELLSALAVDLQTSTHDEIQEAYQLIDEVEALEPDQIKVLTTIRRFGALPDKYISPLAARDKLVESGFLTIVLTVDSCTESHQTYFTPKGGQAWKLLHVRNNQM